MSELTREDLVVDHGQGEQTSSDMRIIFRTEKLGGFFSIMEGEVRPKELLAPHAHANEDQHMYIIEGELEFEVGGKGGLRFTAGPGSHVLKPRGISHCFWNVKDTTARYVETSTEAGFEHFVDSREDGVSTMMINGQSDLGMSFFTERAIELMKENGLTGLAGLNMPSPKELLSDPNFKEIAQTPEFKEFVKYIAGQKISEFFGRA